jgi:hypothetical protein
MVEQPDERVTLYGREVTVRQLGNILRILHDMQGLWRDCRKKRCKRHRRCHGCHIRDCHRNFPRTTYWLFLLIESLNAGLTMDEAWDKANRFAYGRNDEAESATPQQGEAPAPPSA